MPCKQNCRAQRTQRTNQTAGQPSELRGKKKKKITVVAYGSKNQEEIIITLLRPTNLILAQLAGGTDKHTRNIANTWSEPRLTTMSVCSVTTWAAAILTSGE